MQSSTAVSTASIPKPRQFKVMLMNSQNTQGQFPRISIKAMVEVFKFTKVHLWQCKVARPIYGSWMELERFSASSHGLLTCSHLSHILAMIPVYWPWHAPAKIKWGGHFGVLKGIWIFLHITEHRTTNSRMPQVKIRFAFFERNI